ncbi:DUF6173 family protein [Rhizobium ruizarguesonis]|uniref:DUF6173 family protein n=1 Tax=Rhizobium ruizarguesonis TaxID=2081791 RepID=UPI001031A7A9|nr:DUF6173 family protein [Rhizobium ruizarguesonis]TBC02108.1 hypothetical protein ELH34_36740 [Rhizobium ruizarguesonis]
MDIDGLLKSARLTGPHLLGKSGHELNPASWMYERIVKSIIDFEEKLDPNLEIGARLVSFASSEIIHIDDVGYWGPDIIKFYGKNADGNPVELMQHMSQLSVLLVAVKPLAEPRRIGFVLKGKLEAEDDRSADEE